MVNFPKPFYNNMFRWLFASWSIAAMGRFAAPVALTFAVLDTMGTLVGLGVVLAAYNIAVLVFLIPAGAVADRFPRITILVCAHLATAGVQAGTATLLFQGEDRLGPLAVLAAATGAAAAFAEPAERGLVAQLTTKQTRQQANSLLGGVENLLAIVCPGLAGIVTAATSGGYVIVFASVCGLGAAACLGLLTHPRRTRTVTRDTPTVRAGWDEFRARPWVPITVAAFSILNCIHCAVWTVLGPLIARQSIGVAAWGAVLGAYAAGVLTAHAIMYRLAVSRLLRLGQISMAVAGPLPLVALAIHAPVLVFAGTAFLSGVGFGLFAVAWETSLQAHVPHNAFARVAAFDRVGALAAIPLGQLTATTLATSVGTTEILFTGAIAFLTVGLLPLASTQVRHLNRVPTATKPTALVHRQSDRNAPCNARA